MDNCSPSFSGRVPYSFAVSATGRRLSAWLLEIGFLHPDTGRAVQGHVVSTRDYNQAVCVNRAASSLTHSPR